MIPVSKINLGGTELQIQDEIATANILTIQELVNTNTSGIATNACAIADNASAIAVNASAIADNTSGIAGNVVTSGSNDNGSWTKFPDGTMICKTGLITDTTNDTGNITWNFPIAFNTIDDLTITANVSPTLSSTQIILPATPYTDKVNFLMGNAGISLKNSVVKYMAIAIGKWK